MHRVLRIQEILLNIFGYCPRPTPQSPTSDLPALARTCRTFKEPALDVLWEELVEPSPLAQCLPEASQYSQVNKVRCFQVFVLVYLVFNFFFPLLVHEALFVYQTTYKDRVGCPSELHASHSNHAGHE